MNLFDRFILTLYSLALTILSVVVMALTLGIISFELALTNLQAIYEVGHLRYTYFIAALIFFLISLKFLFLGFRSQKNKEKVGKEAIAETTSYGRVSISSSTIDSITLKATRKVRGVQEAKNTISTDETGTSIFLRVSVDGETPIPTIVEEIQKNVTEQIEKIVGMKVKQVDVKITEVSGPPSTRLSRVE